MKRTIHALVLTTLIGASVCLGMGSKWAVAESKPPVSRNSALTPVVGHYYALASFTPTRLPYLRDFDRVMTDFDLREGELLRTRREDFGGDKESEWLIVSPDRLCVGEACSYAVVDAGSAREIGRFSGTIIVLNRRQNGYAVIQTVNRQDEGYFSLRTYVFVEATYQVEDEVLIGEAARLRLMSTLDLRS